MKTSVLFLSLFFMMLFGNVNSFAVKCFFIHHQSSAPISNCSSIKNIQTGYDHIYFKNLTQSQGDEIHICEEIEEPDSDELSSKKNRVIYAFFPLLYHQYFFYNHHNGSKPFPFLWRTTSQRYILQRALRI